MVCNHPDLLCVNLSPGSVHARVFPVYFRMDIVCAGNTILYMDAYIQDKVCILYHCEI